MIASGTDCRLREKLKTAIDPSFIYDARDISARRAIWFIESPKVLGSERYTTSRISLNLTFQENHGKRPTRATLGTWISTWNTAPRTTPYPRPEIPNIGYKNMIPKMIPTL